MHPNRRHIRHRLTAHLTAIVVLLATGPLLADEFAFEPDDTVTGSLPAAAENSESAAAVLPADPDHATAAPEAAAAGESPAAMTATEPVAGGPDDPIADGEIAAAALSEIVLAAHGDIDEVEVTIKTADAKLFELAAAPAIDAEIEASAPPGVAIVSPVEVGAPEVVAETADTPVNEVAAESDNSSEISELVTENDVSRSGALAAGADGGAEMIEEAAIDAVEAAIGVAGDAETTPDLAAVEIPTIPLADAVAAADGLAAPLEILGTVVQPGTAQRLSWSATELFEGVAVSTPVLVINGALAGPTLCLTAAVHGDELNGIEMVRRVMHDLSPPKMSGAVIGVPIVNVQGFRRGTRYLPDRRDLNRYFPGNPNGSSASRIAYSFFTNIIAKCDALIDLHTGSFERANLPQIRADLRDPDVLTLTQGFGSMVILHSAPAVGTLRHAATMAGIPTVTLEAGGPSQLELKEVKLGVKGVETLINTLGMIRKVSLWGDPEPVYYQSSWVRANNGGILLADVGLGSTVRKGDLLGTITDPMNNARTELRSPYSGRVIGMARNQVVMPGFAAFHVGIQTDQAPIDAMDDGMVVTEQYESIDDIDSVAE